MKRTLLSVSMLAMLSVPAISVAASGVKVGTLSCRERPGLGLLVGSSRAVHCIYEGEGVTTAYDGRITKIGVDVGYHGPTRMVWAVFAPGRLGPGALSGHYGGVTAGAAVGVGLGANALVGGSGRSIALQPLSVEGSTGLAVAAGVGGMTLEHVPGTTGPA